MNSPDPVLLPLRPRLAEPQGYRPRVVFFYQFCTLGGCETVLKTRMTELLARGVDAHVVFLEGGDGQALFDDIAPHVTISSNYRHVTAKLAELRPDFLVSIDTPDALRYQPGTGSRARWIYEVHTTYSEGLRVARSLPNRGVSAVLVPSFEQRNLVHQLVGSTANLNVEVVPNPLSPAFTPTSVAVNARCPVVCWVGRLDNHKNWRLFVQAASRAAKRGIDCEFWIVGGGSAARAEKEQLWQTVRDLGLVERLRWVPRVEYDDMPNIYRFVAGTGGCLISTSRQESFGMVALEAMGCGCPVVVPDIGGFRDFVEHGISGLRFPVGDADVAAERIVELLSPSLRRDLMINAALEMVRSRYTAPAVVDAFLRAVSKISAKAAAAAA
ncbi:MAG: glycosyltransferase family 4 protein [Pirellulales bacterium]|nr:glycosyltransferase family 4 protein [Pirellulales bacterium]